MVRAPVSTQRWKMIPLSRLDSNAGSVTHIANGFCVRSAGASSTGSSHTFPFVVVLVFVRRAVVGECTVWVTVILSELCRESSEFLR